MCDSQMCAQEILKTLVSSHKHPEGNSEVGISPELAWNMPHTSCPSTTLHTPSSGE